MSDCAKCDSATSCTECSTLWLANDYYGTGSYNKCITCPPGDNLALPVVLSNNKVCQKCSNAIPKDNCVTCNGSQCLSCSRSYYLSANACIKCSTVHAQATHCVERAGGTVEILECSTTFAIIGGRAPDNSCTKCPAPLSHRFDLVGEGYYSNNSTLY
jgi:hypothetical protein